MIKIGLLGLGTVGSGVVELLESNKEAILKKMGEEIVIKKILVRDVHKPRQVKPRCPVTDDPEEVLNDGDIDIIVELMGGVEPALTYIKRALNSGKPVVTANKELISTRGQELFKLAAKNKAGLLFEASVGGGIPIIRPLKQCLIANDIREIMAVINGTTNFILSEMTDKQKDFKEVLEQAQKQGYAESDPSADIDGLDAGRKLAILSSIAFNTRIVPEDIHTEGIRNISSKDIKYARELGYVIKLLAVARRENGRVEAWVSPVLLPEKHPLAKIGGVFNAIMVHGSPVGQVMFYGRGAGKDATASAVVGDVLDIVRHRGYPSWNGCTCFETKKVVPVYETVSQFYIRMTVEDKPGVLAKIAGALGENNVSLLSVVQKYRWGDAAEIVLVTHKVKSANLFNALDKIKSFNSTKAVSNTIRVEGAEIL